MNENASTLLQLWENLKELKFPGTLRNQSTKRIVILNKKYEKI